MLILAIDTSTDYLSVAVARDGKVLSSYHRRAHMRHSSRLIIVIDYCLKRARVKLDDMDCLAISIGPGSFTGLRIGVTTVKALAFALKKPIVSVPTLDVIAENAKKICGCVCPVIDAKKKKVYAAFYKSDGKTVKRISKYLLLEPADLIKMVRCETLFLGSGIDVYGDLFKNSEKRARLDYKKDWHPRASVAASLAADKFKKKIFSDAFNLVPMYLYSKECDIKGR